MSDGQLWTVIVPVKSLAWAKSRLGEDGPLLARAFLTDMLGATIACESVGWVSVVTADPEVASIARGARCSVVDDTGHPGINAAAAWAASRLEPRGRVAILVSDLPCLTPDVLALVLESAGRLPRSFLPDASGEGTAMWFTVDGPVEPLFGPASAQAHRSRGDVDLLGTDGLDPARILRARRDVDTPEDLKQARALGLGEHSARLVRADG